MSDTGRFTVVTKSGRKFLVEPINGAKTDWGNLNPATGKIEQVHAKSKGSINEKDSIIKKENGFKNIVMLEGGVSPLGYISMLDESGVDRIEMDGIKYEY